MSSKYSKKHPVITIWVGALYGSVILCFMVAALAIFPLFALGGAEPAFPFYAQASYWLMWIAALTMVAVAVLTMPNPDGYDWDADFSKLPAMVRWPLTVATWLAWATSLIGILWAGITSGGGTPPGGTRFMMSVTSAIGALLSLIFTYSLTLPGSALLVCVWALPVILFFIRGLIGIATRLRQGFSAMAPTQGRDKTP